MTISTRLGARLEQACADFQCPIRTAEVNVETYLVLDDDEMIMLPARPFLDSGPEQA